MIRLFTLLPRRRVHRWAIALCLASLLLCVGLSPQRGWGTSPLPAPQLVQQGVERYQAGEYRQAIALWETARQIYAQSGTASEQGLVAQNLARAHQQLGEYDRAIALWDSASRLYRQAGDTAQSVRTLIEQAQAYSRLGQHRKAIALLCAAVDRQTCAPNTAVQLAQTLPDSTVLVAALGSLGNAYRLLGDYDAARKNLEASLQLAQDRQAVAYQAPVLESLGILHSSLAQVSDRQADLAQQSGDTPVAERLRQQAQQSAQRAQTYLEQGIALANTQPDAAAALRSQLALIPIYTRLQSATQSAATWQDAYQRWQTLPDSRDRVYAAIDLARLLQPQAPSSWLQCLPGDRAPQADPLLRQAVAIARRLKDDRAASFALGELGRLYECQGKLAEALDFTQQARLAAEQALNAKDSLYLWEWQTGRILRQQGQTPTAIAAYGRAVNTLQSIRGDILTAARDVQFDFRDTIDPIYRQLVELQLDQKTPVLVGTKSLAQTPEPTDFREILRTVDDLKLAELQNYFGNDCVIAVANQDSVDLGAQTAAAVFSTLVLRDRTAVIVSLPNGQQQFTWIPVPRSQLDAAINAYRQGLEDSSANYDLRPAQQVYDWLIRPFAEALEQAQVKTLVFLQDGILRTVPMAALHDGNQFLIQRYAVATTPSLSLTDPKAIDRENMRVLALGTTQATVVDGQPFSALPNVAQELAGIRDLIPGSQKLLDEAFTRDRLQQELSNAVYPILHIATHGKFATNARDTFIITGDGQKLTFNELDQLIRRVSRNTEPLDLLSLTACETAVGNDRAALGLAGVAVQAGARSAIASLWSVNDLATAKFATEFYARLLNPTVSKAEALRSVQQDLLTGKLQVPGLDTQHPAYWSAFVLIGNWL